MPARGGTHFGLAWRKRHCQRTRVGRCDYYMASAGGAPFRWYFPVSLSVAADIVQQASKGQESEGECAPHVAPLHVQKLQLPSRSLQRPAGDVHKREIHLAVNLRQRGSSSSSGWRPGEPLGHTQWGAKPAVQAHALASAAEHVPLPSTAQARAAQASRCSPCVPLTHL